LKLLNNAREKLKEIIDVLHEPHKGERKKIRTYRRKARKEYLKAAKKRRPSKQKISRDLLLSVFSLLRNLGFLPRSGKKFA